MSLLDLVSSIDFRAAAVAAVASVACALVGSMLVVRRQSMLGDALSHAVLPGIAVAFLATGSLAPGPMLAGAVGSGLVTAFAAETLRRRGGVGADAALGIAYTAMFALGVVLVKQRLDGAHFDVACVYEGSLLHAALDTVSFAGVEAPRALWSALAALGLVLGVYAALWKELKLCAFDSALATTMGYSAGAVHYLLMALVAVTAAVAIEAVGAILVVAMMITPAATAQLLSHRLAPMTALAALIAATTAVGGYALAVWFDVSPAGAIASLAGVVYAIAALVSPSSGVVAKLVDAFRLAQRVRRDDIVGLVYRHEEHGGSAPLPVADVLAAVGSGFSTNWALWRLAQRGSVHRTPEGLRLTDEGRVAAERLVRSHRLWEAYLVETVGLPSDHVHAAADLVEHFVDPALEADLRSTLGDAPLDPHGRPIPSRD
ncbi:MAG: metal ABC transporter permease [Lacipirellulaceae bacterium]